MLCVLDIRAETLAVQLAAQLSAAAATAADTAESSVRDATLLFIRIRRRR